MAYRLFPFAPIPTDATSFYRCRGITPSLRRAHPDIEIVTPPASVNWPDYIDYDCIFIQRGCTPPQLQLAERAKKYGVPVIGEWDDDLFSLMMDNPTFAQYNSPDSKRNVEAIARICDAIIVSTDALASRMRQFNENVYVVPNAIDFKIFKPMSTDLPRQKVVLWRGGHTHDRDLETYAHEIIEAYNKFPDWAFVFLGHQPWRIIEKMNPKRVSLRPFTPEVIDFIHDLQKIRAAIHIVPLHDNIFNHAKSCIAHLEGTLAGSAILGPDWKEWQDIGCVNYKNPQDFGERLQALMAAPHSEIQKINENALSKIGETRNLARTTQMRLEILSKHAGLRDPKKPVLV